MKILFAVLVLLVVSLPCAAQSGITIPSGSSGLAIVSGPDSTRIWNNAITYYKGLGYIFRAPDTLKAFNDGFVSKVCPPGGFSQAYVDSVAHANYVLGKAAYPDSLCYNSKTYIPKP